MKRIGAGLAASLLLASAAAADAASSCRWATGTTAVAYASREEKGATATDVRALMQGAPLVAANGEPPRFPSLSAAQPQQETAPLVCADPERVPVDGVLELTFTRRVRLGIEYTLGRCRLFYRCPAAQADGAPAPPERLLSAQGPLAAPSRDAPSD